MRINQAFPSKYLSHDDLKGRRCKVTIESCTLEKFKDQETGESQQKPALHFVGVEKSLLCNITNWNSISEGLGLEDSDDWTGHQIVLYPTKTQFGKKMVPCLRVEVPQQPVAPVAPPTAEPLVADPDDPFPPTVVPEDEPPLDDDVPPF